jgi:alpha/beta superfamily hydrolase
MEKRKCYAVIGFLFILSSFVLFSLSVFFAFSLREQRLRYLKKEDIYFESFYVRTRDDVSLKAILYIDEDLFEKDDNSVPSILMINGINAKADFHIKEVFQLVKRDYAVFVVEQRGHGDSGGPSGFLSKEPKDMMEVMDYIEEKYEFANISHMGLLGFSYGGGIGAILQAKDDRIYATVLYHPLTSIEAVTERIPFQNLVGTTPIIDDIDNIKDATEIADEENTKNLLIIQGLEDKIILPEESEEFYDSLNGKTRVDIALQKIPGKNHDENEKSETSFKYALIWFEHFYKDPNIDITNRNEEIKNISLKKFDYPDNFLSELFLILSVLSLFAGMSLIIIKFLILPIWENKSFQNISQSTPEKIYKYKKMIKLRTIFYIVPVILVGVICSVFNTSLIYGYFVAYPIVSIIFLLFIPSELHSSWKEEWKKWLKNDSKIFFYSLSTSIIPTVLFILVFSLNANLMFKTAIPMVNTTFIVYLFIFFGAVVLDFVYLREWKPRHTTILIVLRPVTLLIFVLFVPIEPFPLLGGLPAFILFFLLIGVLLWYLRQFSLICSKYFKNYLSTYGLILFPVIIIIVYLFFRIL